MTIIIFMAAFHQTLAAALQSEIEAAESAAEPFGNPEQLAAKP